MVLLRHRWFYLSCLAAFTAGHMVNYSVIIYAQEVIGSDLLSGIGFGLCFGPPIVLGWYAGVLCDRLAPGRLIQAAQALFMLAAALLWLADAQVADAAARVPMLVAAAALAGVGWSFVSPARMAALGQIASSEEIRPASVIFNLLVMLGFGLGPLLIAIARSRAGWPGVFGAALTLFAIASVTLLAVRTRASDRVHEPVATEIRQGLAAVRANPLLLQLMVAAMAGYLAMGPMTVLLPKLAATRLGLAELQRGYFLGTLALSLIAGGIVALLLARRAHQGRSILAGTVLAGLLLSALGHDEFGARGRVAVVRCRCRRRNGAVAHRRRHPGQRRRGRARSRGEHVHHHQPGRSRRRGRCCRCAGAGLRRRRGARRLRRDAGAGDARQRGVDDGVTAAPGLTPRRSVPRARSRGAADQVRTTNPTRAVATM